MKKCENCWEGSGVVSVDVSCPDCMGPRDIRLHDERLTMFNALVDLIEWEAHMGGWDAPAWKRAKRLLNKIRK